LLKLFTLTLLLLGIASEAGAVERPATAPPSRQPTCGRAAELNYCRYAGPAPALVLLTGLGNSMRTWPPPFLHELNALAEVVVYDRRGYGPSAALQNKEITAQQVALDLESLLAQLRLGAVVLVGHSLGGLYAQYFARNHPDQVAAVVLLDASSPFEPIDDPRFQTTARLEPDSIEDLEQRGVHASLLQTRSSPPWGTIPLLVISATHHGSPPAVEAEWQRIQAATASQSSLGRLVVARGSGHDIAIDQPALVVSEIQRLLQTLHGQAPPAVAPLSTPAGAAPAPTGSLQTGMQWQPSAKP
jgi:pimeloyl-ACP methyl ester carboxylesterase